MRGRLQLRVIRRLVTESWKFADKYVLEDRLVLYFIVNEQTKKRYFKVYSIIKEYKPVIISRDELAFIRMINLYYGEGDYYIRCWGKGKNKGIRNFWDGVITPEKKFYRRKISYAMNPTIRTKMSDSGVSGDFIGHYCKTKAPGKWYSL
jgi:hypothetical protein